MGTEVIATTEETVKSDNPTDLEQKIIRQVEYYFGNFNLCKDKFLRDQVKQDEGWVPLEILVKFKRLKSLSEDYKVICDSLRKSTNDLLEINEDSTKLRRRVEKPVPDEGYLNKDAIGDRTIYVKGFKKTTTLDELLDFFKEYKAENIYMKRIRNSKVFKGSCFIMFETKEDAEKFFENKGVKYEGIELLKERKKDYMKRKDEFYSNLRAEKEKKLQRKAENSKETGEVPDLEIVPGCLLKITGLNEAATREDIKSALEGCDGLIVYVDYYKGKSEGVVRFDTGVAAKVLEKINEDEGESKLTIGSSKGTLSVIEGEEEKEYWKNIAVSRANSKLRHSQYQKQHKGRFKKNWGKRERGGHRDGGPSSKRVKTEESEEKVKVKNEDTQEQSVQDEPSSKRVKTEESEEKVKVKKEDTQMERSHDQENAAAEAE